MAVLNNPEKEAQSPQGRQAAHRKGITLASVAVLIVDVFGLLALAVIVPFLRGYGEDVTSLMGSSVPGIIEFLISINGIDYALFFVVLALIMIVKEIPIRDKKVALGANITVAAGGIIFAVVFTIAMHVPTVMMFWDISRL